jgi:putative nucleotidyltransferase with HDIG domain
VRSEKILVIDRDRLARESVGALLLRDGYLVECVPGPDEALRLLAYKPIDLVLVDIALEDSTSVQLLDQIHQRDNYVPVIVITGSQDAHQTVHALRNGAVDVLIKPFEASTMLTAVARAVTRGAKNRQASVYRDGLENLIENRTKQLRAAMFELERSYDTTLEALGDALDLKDSETEGHSRRVTAFTIALGRCMGIGAEEIKTIKHGAFLHDIGKMAIPDRILLKPGRLDAEETEIMRRHCVAGYQIVHKIPFLRDAAEIVHSHQEHYDGGGYPRKLRGENIPLGARIFAVADTLDAITSDRPYRKGSPFSVARNEISRCAGTQFDPRIVDAFLSVPIKVWEELRDSIAGR